jgi:3-oxoacyl-[acyl-carrier-protein] synthase II
MHDVYVTGAGILTSIGHGCVTFWQALTRGDSGVGAVTRFDSGWFPVQIAAEIKNFPNISPYCPAAESSLRLSARLTLAAAREALNQAGLLSPEGVCTLPSTGLLIGSNKGDLWDIEQQRWRTQQSLLPSHAKKITAQILLTDNTYYGVLPRVAEHLRLTGPQHLITNACSAGAYTLALGAEQIRQGQASVVLCGGVDVLNESIYAGFSSLRSLAPERCQPFDLHRQGLVLGEAAAMLVLESKASCQARGIQPLAALAGWGMSCDAHHLSAPHPEGKGTILALQRALKNACLTPGRIDCLVAHGTGTIGNDRMEAQAFRTIFGEAAPPVTAPKSMLGHSIGAASAVEALVAALITQNDLIPPTINFETPDPECPIDCVPNQVRKKIIRACQTNASSFGGNNVSLIFTKPSPHAF